MAPPIPAELFAGLLFLGMVILLEAGRRLGIKRARKSRTASEAAWVRSKVRFSPCLA